MVVGGAMKQIEFERRYQAFWQECEEQFMFMRQSSKAPVSDDFIQSFPRYYKLLCQQLAILKKVAVIPLY